MKTIDYIPNRMNSQTAIQMNNLVVMRLTYGAITVLPKRMYNRYRRQNKPEYQIPLSQISSFTTGSRRLDSILCQKLFDGAIQIPELDDFGKVADLLEPHNPPDGLFYHPLQITPFVLK